MKTKDRLYTWLNNGTFNEKDGCRHPQDIIAAALGCTERTVIRCVQQLEREGRLTVDRPRRRGACNTYHVSVWNPSKRSGVVNVLTAVRPSVLRAREAKCHPKGTADLPRAHTAPRAPLSFDESCSTSAVERASNCAEQPERPNRGSANTNAAGSSAVGCLPDRLQPRHRGYAESGTDWRRAAVQRHAAHLGAGAPGAGRMTHEPAAAPHLRVVGCADCERLRSALDAALLDLDNANVDLTVKRRKITRLENELAEKHRSDPMYTIAETIFFFWQAKCQPKARTFSEDRLKAVLARLKDRDPLDPEQAAYTPRFICEAVLGAAVDPYVDPKGKRHNDLELVCRSGRKLEDFAERWERYRAKREATA